MYSYDPRTDPLWHSRRLRGAAGRAPPIIELGGKGILLPRKKIQVRIFENIETTSETKTNNFTTSRNTTMKQLFQLFTPDNLQNLKNFIFSKIDMY